MGRTRGLLDAFRRCAVLPGVAGLGLLATASTVPASADVIVWGDDTGPAALDRACSDPRFSGPGMAPRPDEASRFRDASDCAHLFKRNRITLVTTDGGEAAPPPSASARGALDFGDDSGTFALDGQCDDPRFRGEGMPAVLLDADRLRDASDCRALYERGAIRLRDVGPTEPVASSVADPDFGDDSGRYASDGECDDPRFEGPGMSAADFRTQERADASDCRRLFQDGAITLAAPRSDEASSGSSTAPSADAASAAEPSTIDFGDDSGRYPSDGECDDPRFTGPGMSAADFRTQERADASDCRRLFEDGAITLADRDGLPTAGASDIAFGDDGGPFPNDGECEDPRFVGRGMAAPEFLGEEGADASDCRRLLEAGAVALRDAGASVASSGAGDVDFGDDSGPYASDGECDDPRFRGAGMSAPEFRTYERRDATDCRRLFERGEVTLSTPAEPDARARAIEDVNGIDFGDDSGLWPNDAQCDDPRFEGRGMAAPDYLTQERRDASDCSRLYREGQIELSGETRARAPDPPNASPDDAVASAAETSPGSRDSARASDAARASGAALPPSGDGVSTAPAAPSAAPGGATATAAVRAPAADEIVFGTDTSRWANDGECDDPRFEGDGMSLAPAGADREQDATDCRRLFVEGRIRLRP